MFRKVSLKINIRASMCLKDIISKKQLEIQNKKIKLMYLR